MASQPHPVVVGMEWDLFLRICDVNWLYLTSMTNIQLFYT